MAEFHNPQQEPGMERKLLLVFALTFLVIILFQPILKKYLPQPPARPESPQAVTAQNPAQPSMPASAMGGAPSANSSAAEKAIVPVFMSFFSL